MVPLSTRGTHAPALHHLSEVQSASLVHFPDVHVFVIGSQVGVVPEHFASVAQGSHLPRFGPVVMQSPERHCAVFAHVPSPVAKPHLLSAASQAPLAQTMEATAGVQVPVSAGAWPATVGMGLPFGSFGVHVPALHQVPPVQSASTLHPPAP